MEDGYIKYKAIPSDKEIIRFDCTEINKVRKKLYKRGLIGIDNNVGYGNISLRSAINRFVITGSGTGRLKQLHQRHYARVLNWDFAENWVFYQGATEPSSESMTHASLYHRHFDIEAVIHIHNKEMWKQLMYSVPTTSKNVEYGTPELAYEVDRLFDETNIMEKGIFVTAGHEDGVFTFGRSLREALGTLVLMMSTNYKKPQNYQIA